MNDLDHFEAWCKQTGAYQALAAIQRYRLYKDNMKAREGDVLRERVKDE